MWLPNFFFILAKYVRSNTDERWATFYGLGAKGYTQTQKKGSLYVLKDVPVRNLKYRREGGRVWASMNTLADLQSQETNISSMTGHEYLWERWQL